MKHCNARKWYLKLNIEFLPPKNKTKIKKYKTLNIVWTLHLHLLSPKTKKRIQKLTPVFLFLAVLWIEKLAFPKFLTNCTSYKLELLFIFLIIFFGCYSQFYFEFIILHKTQLLFCCSHLCYSCKIALVNANVRLPACLALPALSILNLLNYTLTHFL